MYARRRYPIEIFSKNGSNLRGADRELRLAIEELYQEALKGKLNVKSILVWMEYGNVK